MTRVRRRGFCELILQPTWQFLKFGIKFGQATQLGNCVNAVQNVSATWFHTRRRSAQT